MNADHQDQRTQIRSMILKKILIFLGKFIFQFFFWHYSTCILYINYFSFFSFVLCKWIFDLASIFCFRRRVKENWKSKISAEIKKNVKNKSFERRNYKWFTIRRCYGVLKKLRKLCCMIFILFFQKHTIKIQKIFKLSVTDFHKQEQTNFVKSVFAVLFLELARRTAMKYTSTVRTDNTLTISYCPNLSKQSDLFLNSSKTKKLSLGFGQCEHILHRTIQIKRILLIIYRGITISPHPMTDGY